MRNLQVSLILIPLQMAYVLLTGGFQDFIFVHGILKFHNKVSRTGFFPQSLCQSSMGPFNLFCSGKSSCIISLIILQHSGAQTVLPTGIQLALQLSLLHQISNLSTSFEGGPLFFFAIIQWPLEERCTPLMCRLLPAVSIYIL